MYGDVWYVYHRSMNRPEKVDLNGGLQAIPRNATLVRYCAGVQDADVRGTLRGHKDECVYLGDELYLTHRGSGVWQTEHITDVDLAVMSACEDKWRADAERKRELRMQTKLPANNAMGRYPLPSLPELSYEF